MIATIKKKYIICRGSGSAGALESFVFFAFSLCNVNYLKVKSTVSGLGFKIRNSSMSWGNQSCQSWGMHSLILVSKWLLLNAVSTVPVLIAFSPLLILRWDICIFVIFTRTSFKVSETKERGRQVMMEVTLLSMKRMSRRLVDAKWV